MGILVTWQQRRAEEVFVTLISLELLLSRTTRGNCKVPTCGIGGLRRVLTVVGTTSRASDPIVLRTSHNTHSCTKRGFLHRLIVTTMRACPRVPIIVRRSRNGSPTAYCSTLHGNFADIVVSNSLRTSTGAPTDFRCGITIADRIIGITRSVNYDIRNRLNYLNSLRANRNRTRSNRNFRNALDGSRLLASPSRTIRFIRTARISTLTITVNADRNTCGFAHGPANRVLTVDHVRRVRHHLPGARLMVRKSSSIPRG